MNRHRERLMGKPSIESDLCPFCGRKATNRHHIVPRSAGGTHGPTVTVCGSGTTGCHGLFEELKLHLDWEDGIGWMWKRTDKPEKDVWIDGDDEGWMELRAAKRREQM